MRADKTTSSNIHESRREDRRNKRRENLIKLEDVNRSATLTASQEVARNRNK